jgi:hypothetical protein
MMGNLTAGDGNSNYALPDVTGLFSSGSFLVDIDNSMISATMVGDLVAGGGTIFDSAFINLTGLLGVNGADIDIDASTVAATLTGSFWGGDGDSDNIAGSNVTGVLASASTLRVHNGSIVQATVDGDLHGGAAGANNVAAANVAAVLGSDGKVAVEDSSLLARLSGDLDSGPGGDASAYLAALAYLGNDIPPPGPYALSVTGSTLSVIRTGIDLSGPGTLQTGIDLFGTEPVDVLFADNRFAGTFAGPGSNLFLFQDEDYTVDSLSIGNTIEPGTTVNAPHCSDGGSAWGGSFEIAGITYDASTCAD